MQNTINIHEKKKRKIEFSKIVVLILGIVGVAVLVASFHLMYLTLDLSPLMYIIPSTQAVIGVGLGFYFSKAKVENKIKLMKKYGVEPTEETFNEGDVI